MRVSCLMLLKTLSPQRGPSTDPPEVPEGLKVTALKQMTGVGGTRRASGALGSLEASVQQVLGDCQTQFLERQKRLPRRPSPLGPPGRPLLVSQQHLPQVAGWSWRWP